ALLEQRAIGEAHHLARQLLRRQRQTQLRPDPRRLPTGERDAWNQTRSHVRSGCMKGASGAVKHRDVFPGARGPREIECLIRRSLGGGCGKLSFLGWLSRAGFTASPEGPFMPPPLRTLRLVVHVRFVSHAPQPKLGFLIGLAGTDGFRGLAALDLVAVV